MQQEAELCVQADAPGEQLPVDTGVLRRGWQPAVRAMLSKTGLNTDI